MSFARFMFAPAAVGVIALTTGCDNTLALPLATVANVIDTVTLYALQGTAIIEPSGFDVVNARPARTDRQGEQFDMAFDIDETGLALIFTTASLGLDVESAIQPSDRNFADITIAPLEDYEMEEPLEVGVESVFLVRSRPDAGVGTTACAFFLGQLPRYGKFRVLSLDAGTRQITLEILVNLNCGYRSLEAGVPIR
jgi:hypothetical protein